MHFLLRAYGRLRGIYYTPRAVFLALLCRRVESSYPTGNPPFGGRE